MGIFMQIAFFRLIMGIGIGGEYPLAAAIASENAEKKERDIAAVFSMQGSGCFWSMIFFFYLSISDRICLWCFAIPHRSIEVCTIFV